jgi:hypothetical protein
VHEVAVLDAACDQVLGVDAGDGAEAAGGVEGRPVLVGQAAERQAGELTEEGFQLALVLAEGGLALAQRLLRPLPLGDVHRHADQARGPPGGVVLDDLS